MLLVLKAGTRRRKCGEDGCLTVLGPGEEAITAFTHNGRDNLTETLVNIIRFLRAFGRFRIFNVESQRA
jgi:hypothetical protein